MSLLLQPRWIAGHLLVLALVVLFVRLGFWQLDRHAQHRERNERIEARLAAPPISLMELVGDATAGPGIEGAGGAGVVRSNGATGEPAGAGASGGDLEDRLAYRRVSVEGRFDASEEVLLRSQTYRGQPGWHVLTPLSVAGTDDAVAVLVDRGWVPQPFDTPPVGEAPPPAGIVQLEGVLVPEQDPATGPLAGFAAANPEEGPLERTFLVDAERLAPQMPYALVPAYLIPVEGELSGGGDLPVPAEPPAPEAGTHLAYAIQWFIFAGIGIVGYGLLLRQRMREDREERASGRLDAEPPA